MQNPVSGGLEPSAFGKILLKIDKTLYFIEDKFTIACFTGMTLAVLFGIVMRFILRIPNQYGEEISRYLMILSIFTGIGIVERTNGQMKIDLFVSNLPEKAGRVLSVLTRFITVGAYLWLSIIAFQYVQKIYTLNQLSTCLKVPMYIVYSFLLAGFILGLIHALIHACNTYFLKVKLDLNSEDGEDVEMFYD